MYNCSLVALHRRWARRMALQTHRRFDEKWMKTDLRVRREEEGGRWG